MPRLIWVFAGRTLILLVLSYCGSVYSAVLSVKFLFICQVDVVVIFVILSYYTLFHPKKSVEEDDDDAATPTEHTIKENIIHVGQEVKQGVQKVGNTVKPVLQTVQTGMKSGVQSVQSGVKAGVQSVSNMWTAFKNRRTEHSLEHSIEKNWGILSVISGKR